MSFLGLLVKKKEKRSFTEEEREELISLLPGFQGTPSNWESINAIKDSDVFTAVHMIASDIASLDLEKRKGGIKDNNDKVSHLFNKKPNEFYTGYQLKFILVANALLNGESFAEVVKDNSGNVQGIYHIPNRKMTHKQDETTNFRLLYGIHEGDRTRWVKSDRILHFKFFSLDGVTGISPLKALSDDIDTQKNSKRFLSNFFRNGTQNGGLLTFKGGKLSKEAREKLKEEWQKANSGVESAHKVIVLDETMEYEPIEVNTEVLKLINTSQHSTVQVAKVFGIPRHKFGLETSNMSIEQMNMDYLVNTLNPYLKSMTREIIFKLMGNTEMRRSEYVFNTDDYKLIDSETKVNNIVKKLENGIISLDEARKEFGDDPIGGMGEKHFINLNLTTLDMLEEYQMSKAKNLPVKGGDGDGEGSTEVGNGQPQSEKD